jgi:vancomycin permeability regulator SanA
MKLINKKYLKIGFIVVILAFFTPLIWIEISTKNEIYTEQTAPKERIAIVFGAGVKKNGTPSDILKDRIQTASNLYTQGKIEKILMSGDNSISHYNEPVAMQKYAILLGIPEDKIALDYAGFRTYDTCARAKKVFMINQAILITQKFHLKRAVFLCKSMGIKSSGVIVNKNTYIDNIKLNIRDTLAKIQSFYEVYLIKHDPKFLGEEIPI